jgi:L-malate glycosyltransferase
VSVRICHLIKGLGRGGAESLLPQTIRCRRPGLEFSVGYFLPWKDAMVPSVVDAGGTVHCFGARSGAAMLLRVPAVVRWLCAQQASVVHAHLPLAGVVARLAGAIAGVPVVYTEHNLQERYHRATRTASRLTWRWQRQVVAVSGEVAGSIALRLPASVPVAVVRNGIAIEPSVPTWRAEVRERHGLPADAPVVGTVAVFRAQKRLDLWLQAARRVADTLPEARFLLVGDGPRRAEVESLIETLDLGDRVVLAGLREDPRPYFAALDVFLMSSEFEGLPLALLEAMAYGLPVVATAVGGVPEVLSDGIDGRLVPFGAVGELADRVAELISDEALRGRLAAAARQRVRDQFSVERMAREIEAIYDDILAGGVRSR